MARGIKEKLRKIWIIQILSDGQKWKQQHLRDQLVSNTTLPIEDLQKDVQKKLDMKISKSLGMLERDGIVERIHDKKTPEKYCWLVSDRNKVPKALLKILEMINYPELDDYFSSMMKNDFMTSKYAKAVINQNLVNKFERDLEIELKENEKENVLYVLKISPKYLLTTVRLMEEHESWKRVKTSYVKDFWLSKMQDDLIADSKLLNIYPPTPIRIINVENTIIEDLKSGKIFEYKNKSDRILEPNKFQKILHYEPNSEYSPL
jgi:DNA-binding HxlR family transcriptional regulator